MIGYFWYSIKPYMEEISPALAQLLDTVFEVYQRWADNLPQWLLDDPIGFDYLMFTYWMNSCKQNWDEDHGCYHPKPWILTEWGFTNSPDGIRNVCAVIRDFTDFGSLDGHDFHSYPFLDENVDGIIDHPEAYQALRECFAQTKITKD